ncbi:tRNA uridine-5-carboxymethylaminomethyl(34) synthesis GTPase MnmE [Enterobacteriaceae endosymbiont of Donacia bicoloricornis]|uniref:tRNA uridine-5-carboxymethylaminomethyl(34) synthesis GTPase MnmE n=1 Tax=Enterobacteriaceae endosymbiont of Donacia bicoloricornis TaxID=2675772 RepID=UPI001449ADF8|nr:tRNA uridine-5-carboxymethylaminomethyl(34) synthesis GTPase MnmE [Enterobacteriaceae endosymbiont of Donacia bicoloricornis]QJC37923.1 tRNA uridine-5-carboxymethylaminomethyl(34) synthesis GTPase MnmE [Enterobacteriaceae endosymbiont of Donacia bicoloricornis]
MKKQKNTIIARATPPGQGSIGVIRISGDKVIDVIKYVLKLTYIKPRYAHYLPFFYKEKIIDKGIVLWFPKPNSFTGEDILELQCHGNSILLDLLINNILNISGIRMANPGEFSKRAFLNKKFDLTQAEAIADIISANSKAAIFSAMNLMNGKLSLFLKKFTKIIINLRVKIESFLEFDYKINFSTFCKKILITLEDLLKFLTNIIKYVKNGIRIREGIKITLIGPPNSGKSSLMNLITNKNISIVTNIPGTTRDILHENIYIDSVPIEIIDTAGIRNTNNQIEILGIKKTLKEIKNSNYLFLVIEDKMSEHNLSKIIKKYLKNFIKNIPVLIIRNKIDLTNNIPEVIYNNTYTSIKISIKKKMGILNLIDFIKKKILNKNTSEDQFTARERYLNIFNSIYKHLIEGKKNFLNTNSIELLAEDIRLIQKKLDSITGKFYSEDLLNSIFSQFCVGK